MHFPKLTPLQSRFAASFAASLLLVILYLTFSRPHFAYAFELDSIEHRDHNHPFLLDPVSHDLVPGVIGWNDEGGKRRYEPEFAGLGRSIVGRVAGEPLISGLSNNVPGKMDISGGQVQYWSFSKSDLNGPRSSATPDLPFSQPNRRDGGFQDPKDDSQTKEELKRRQDGDRQLYLTLSVCDQPFATSNNSTSPPPPLQLYVSESLDNQTPGPNAASLKQVLITTKNGYADYITMTSDDTFIGIEALSNSSFQGTYNYEITASIDAPYTFFEPFSNLFYVDSDNSASLLVSGNLTNENASDLTQQQWMNSGSPFNIFVHSQNDPWILGLSSSYCGMKNHAQIQGNVENLGNTAVEVGMTKKGGGLPKQQFYIKNLNSSSRYYAMMAVGSNYTKSGPGNVNGGGTIWDFKNFATKNGMYLSSHMYSGFTLTESELDANCQVIYNLKFCDEVSYAVPSNNKSDVSDLASWYDDNASAYYQNFTYSLEQIACNTTPSAQYSLAVNCSTCDAAYKQWLCAVTIPRCADFSSDDSYLQPRNINQMFLNGTEPSEKSNGPLFSADNQKKTYLNSSRNILIDQIIRPGPYKEILPCKSLCYGLVQNCPALLGFACPPKGQISNQSYWSAAGMDAEGRPMCNIPGAIWGVSDSTRLQFSGVFLIIAFIMALSSSMTGVWVSA